MMALDGEPKDGDYVRYVERLVNRGLPAPGQVGSRDTGGAAMGSNGKRQRAENQPARGGKSASAAARQGYPAGSPARDPALDDGRANAMRTGATAGGTQEPSLAARSAQRKVGTVIFVVAMLIGWHAVRLILAAVQGGEVDVGELLPGVFLLAFALLVLAMSRNIRRNADRPVGKLPPLTTVSGNKPGQGR
ncbi:hypothetical protein [Bordetella sp. N]|uniref:hypothetical protein n=1 Tax=Bordetella sp. N TaxID=1746199 RepID=UPI00070D8C87|nr:hypothetical protein [Bordetella sp. N]ALM82174.1 hypothetical protein ASB57_03655 [Bordetella sp. N]